MTKPSGGGVAHGVLKAPVHSAGSSLRHRPSDFQWPLAAMVGRKHNPSIDTVRKMSKKSIIEAWYDFYVSLKKGMFVSGLGLSPYCSGALSHLRKKNMAGKLFFVFAK